jgi:tetrapyrrole methylase family protein/MazG family protein
VDFQPKERYTLEDLRHILQILRAPGGCPWDRAQNHHSIRNNFIEETYEAVEAIDTENSTLLCEELGDVLFQVLFHCQLEQEAGRFSFEDIVDGTAKKMIERHPHVFGTVQVKDMSELLQNWDAIKKETKHQQSKTDVLRSVSPALPALMRAAKVQKKAQQAGYPPEQNPQPADPQKGGELLLQAVRAVRAAGLEPEQALQQATESYIEEFAEWESSHTAPDAVPAANKETTNGGKNSDE